MDTRKLDYRTHDAEHERLMLVQAALEGLEDVAAGRVLDEAELDQALGSFGTDGPEFS
jgi:predicted transcriptional regulator